MNAKIIFTPLAKDTFLSIISFIGLKWSDKSADKFVQKTYKTLEIIAQQPYLFKSYLETNVRKGLISKHTSVIYRITSDHIEILFFWDNRQEPAFDND